MFTVIRASILVERFVIKYYLASINVKRYVTYQALASHQKKHCLSKVVQKLVIIQGQYVGIDAKRNVILVLNVQIKNVMQR